MDRPLWHYMIISHWPYLLQVSGGHSPLLLCLLSSVFCQFLILIWIKTFCALVFHLLGIKFCSAIAETSLGWVKWSMPTHIGGHTLMTSTKLLGFWTPSPFVCILARLIVLNPRNLPYCIWIPPSPCRRHLNMAPFPSLLRQRRWRGAFQTGEDDSDS